MSETKTMERHIYKVWDGGEQYWYSAASPFTAHNEHLRLCYVEAGVQRPTNELEVHYIPDAQPVTVRDAGPGGTSVTKPAREWAHSESGLIATTCC